MNKEKILSSLKSRYKIILLIIIIAIIFSGGCIYNKINKDESIVLYGNVDIRQVALAFNASERIEEMYFEEGDEVKKGELLATLDTKSLKLQIEKNKAEIETQENVVLRLKNGSRPEEISQKLAQLNAAEAEAKNAKMQLQRIQKAYSNSAGRSISKQEKDEAESKVKITAAQVKEAYEGYQLANIGPREEDIAEAEAQLKGLKAELAIQEYLLSQTQLMAPSDAVIRSRLQEPGDMASPQRATYLLALNDKKWIRAYIQESHLGFVKPGMDVAVSIDSYPDKTINGQVGFISSVAEFTPKAVQTEELRTSLLYEIRIYVNDSEDILRMGMPATIKIDDSRTNTKE
ncbi:efflux RND transporter periplasmic adaptor subunit [Fusobacterium sp.]|uniref:efflux RND transporter periplasmic adaptor subunit n=1 Tax=Fusobacterium sp. TaxID=68766 RepID=UPI002900F71B|nr:efflux RND transporter periplasmic adaptor subunit [Fusobacterium sp.]MDU1911673.1 efflux RND transporter periplasmic adaptor subunit [Fusobacterium sp.]